MCVDCLMHICFLTFPLNYGFYGYYVINTEFNKKNSLEIVVLIQGEREKRLCRENV